MAGVFGQALPPDLHHRYLRVAVAREMGWSLALIDGLGLADWLEVIAVLRGWGDLAAFRAES